MFIILFIINVIAIDPDIHFTKEQEISIYPTIGEKYEFYLSYLKEPQFTRKLRPQIQNVKLMNQCEEIYREKWNCRFKKWKNSQFESGGESMTIGASFNINLSKDFAILVDCQQNKLFFLIQLIDAQQIFNFKQLKQLICRF
ncbi:unnamed protein product [Paramecium octaurelia]|uniref:Uncharacterized protein n=1 Tax=Paramecium octaurelia TaxID=43137 RepID=A0A8S1YGP9_PAROT|nr:unnamed protein product [Paramecium octaurelia]